MWFNACIYMQIFLLKDSNKDNSCHFVNAKLSFKVECRVSYETIIYL